MAYPATQSVRRIEQCFLGLITLGVAAVLANHTVLGGALTSSIIIEDGPVEDLSAAVYLAASIVGIWVGLKQARRFKSEAVLPLFAGLVATLGFLDEVSFGARLGWFNPPVLHDKPIDAVHDVFTVAYVMTREHLSGRALATVVGCAGLVFVTVLVANRKRLDSITRMRGVRWLALAIALVVVAEVIDLDFFNKTGQWAFVYALEEVLEVNGGMALLCASLVHLMDRA